MSLLKSSAGEKFLHVSDDCILNKFVKKQLAYCAQSTLHIILLACMVKDNHFKNEITEGDFWKLMEFQ